jgi:hypothetical protein
MGEKFSMTRFLYFFLAIFFSQCASYEAKSYDASSAVAQESNTSKIQAGLSVSSGKETQRILAYNSNMHFDIPEKSADSVRSQMIDYVKSIDGYIVTENTNMLTVKIPSNQFREAIVELKKMGKVTSENVYTEDITDAYYDVKIRLENYTALQTRLKSLLAKAKTVQEAIEVEKELNRVTNEIEILKGKMNRYENQINFSTINIYIRSEKQTKLGPLGWVVYGAYSAVKWLFVWE